MNIEYELEILTLPTGNKPVDRSGIIQWAKMWDWGVGEIVAERLRRGSYSDWGCAFVAIIDGQYAGFCALHEKDEYGTDLDFTHITPFVGAVYVDPQFRGHRVIGKLLEAACDYARSLQFDAVYLISSHVGLYEKYGFEKFSRTVTLSGTTESVYKREL